MKETIIIKIDGYLFDFTSYIDQHPGGSSILRKYNGKDATDIFNSIKEHNESSSLELLDKFCLGPEKKNSTSFQI